MVEADNECDLPCSRKMWDGYGRWNINDQWKPFIEEINLPSSQSKTAIGGGICEISISNKYYAKDYQYLPKTC